MVFASLLMMAACPLAAIAAPIDAVNTFLPDGTLPPGRNVVSSVPDPNTVPGFSGELPGRGYAFTLDLPAFAVDRVEVGLSYITGSRDVVISIHESVFLDIAFTGVRRTLPGDVLASAVLNNVLTERASVVEWELDSPLLLDPANEYFLTVTTDPEAEPSRFGWNLSDLDDRGFQRVFQNPDRSWGGYAFQTFPRAAFRIQGRVVPEPATALLLGVGLLLLRAHAGVSSESRRREG